MKTQQAILLSEDLVESDSMTHNPIPVPLHNRNYSDIIKTVCNQALPTLGEQLIQEGSSFLNNIFLAKSATFLALPASELISSIQVFFLGLDEISMSAISNDVGICRKDNPQRVGEIFRHGLVFGTVIGISTIVILNCSKPILISLYQEEELATIVGDFFHVFSASVLPTLWLNAEKEIIAGVLERPLAKIFIEVFNAGLTNILAFGMIGGNLGFPACGVRGLAYACTISNTISLCGLTFYLAINKQFKPYDLFKKRLSGDRKIIISLAKSAFPLAIQFGAELGTVVASSFMVGRLGKTSLAAFQVGLQFTMLALSPSIALAHANLVCSAQAIGDGQQIDVKRINQVSIGLGLTFSLLGLIFATTLSSPLINLFIDDELPERESAVEQATRILWLNGLFLLPDAVRFTAGFGLVPLEYAGVTMIASITGLVLVGMPLAYALGFPASMGASGIAIARGIGEIIGMLMILPVLRKITSSIQQESTPREDLQIIVDAPPVEQSVEDVITVHNEQLNNFLIPKKSALERHSFYNSTSPIERYPDTALGETTTTDVVMEKLSP